MFFNEQTPRANVALAIPAARAAAFLCFLVGSPCQADTIQFAGRHLELPTPSAMCALSDQKHKSQIEFAHQVSPGRRLLLVTVPCDRLALYDPNSAPSPNTSLLYDSAEWAVQADDKGEVTTFSGKPADIVSSVKAKLQGVLEALNSARARGERFPKQGAELRNLTVVGEQSDRIFATSISRSQRPFDRGPIDKYTATGFLVISPHVLQFTISSYVKNEDDLLAIARRIINATICISGCRDDHTPARSGDRVEFEQQAAMRAGTAAVEVLALCGLLFLIAAGTTYATARKSCGILRATIAFTAGFAISFAGSIAIAWLQVRFGVLLVSADRVLSIGLFCAIVGPLLGFRAASRAKQSVRA